MRPPRDPRPPKRLSSYFGLSPATLALVMAGAVGAILLVLLVLALLNPVLLRMSVRNIPRRPAQSALIVFGLMLASLIITASFGVADTLGYSLKDIQVRQTGGIDEAVIRQTPRNVQGAGFTDADYFSADQADAVIKQVKADANVSAAEGVLVSDGSLTDTTTGQSTAQNVLLLGVPGNFDTIWGQLASRGGGRLSAADLGPQEVFIGNAAAAKLNASPGDQLNLIVNGKPAAFRVRDILDTEVNPNVAQQGPVVSSVLVPLASMRTILARPVGFNAIYIHNQGNGGLDDLGPDGGRGKEINRRLRGAFTDPRGAADMKDFLNEPPVHRQLQAFYDNANFLVPVKPSIATLLHELAQPGVTDEFKSVVQDDNVRRTVQGVVGQAAHDLGQTPTEAETHLLDLYASLNIDSPTADRLRALLGRPPYSLALEQFAAATPVADPAHRVITDLVREVEAPTTSAHFKAQVAVGPAAALAAQFQDKAPPAVAKELAADKAALPLYQLSPYKQAAVDFAEQAGLGALLLFLGVSFFSVFVGVLLIFLIFVMLAAERRAEMGMSRAVGLKRRHLTQMFLFEGFAYTIGAAAVGVALGVGVGAVMVGVISSIFSTYSSTIRLTFHVEPASVVIAFGLGIVLTFIAVGVSAYRVSRLNIVAAIRDIDETGTRDEGLAHYFLGIFRVAGSGFRILLRGHPLTFLRRVTVGVAGAARAFLWALFRRGPFTLLAAWLLVSLGLRSHVAVLYLFGIGIACIGAGLLVRWILATFGVRPSLAGRIGFTLAAVGLFVYYGQPFGRVEKLLKVDKSYGIDKLNGGPELFIASTLLLLLGVVWLVMYNSDFLIRAVMLLGRSLGSAGAAVRTSMSYPMATKFRTGMTVAMFATVTFIIAYMAVFEDVLNQSLGQATARAGGWQLVAGSPDQVNSGSAPPGLPTDLASRVSSDSRLRREVAATGWENASSLLQMAQVVNGKPVQVRGAQRGRETGVNLHVVDDNFLAATTYALAPRADGYSSDRAAWDAVRNHEGYAVLDTSLLSALGPTAAPITGIKATDATFKPFEVELKSVNAGAGGAGSVPWRVTVVGFIKMPVWQGLFTSPRTAMARSGLFNPAAPPGRQLAPPAVGAKVPLNPTGYFFAVTPGADVNHARLDLARLLVAYELEPVSVADQLAQQTSSTMTLFNLLSGFLALGLVVGIAGLGVISTRAVVERRQQIGMLRALGFRRSLVQASFLMESSFIAILGLAIGAGLGIWQSYRFIVVDQSFGQIDFHVPVLQLALILGGAYVATLLTTYLPSRQASRVAPADALRYE